MSQNLEMKLLRSSKKLLGERSCKSVPSVPEAVSLIKNVREMCAAGEFKLTMFVIHSKVVLLSIPEADTRQGINDK